LLHIYPSVAQSAFELVQGCACLNGCPSCVGPALEVGDEGKQGALRLLRYMTAAADGTAYGK